MVRRHFFPLLTAMLLMMQASLPGEARAQGHSTLLEGPRYGIGFGAVTVLLFEGQPESFFFPAERPESSRGLVAWQTRSLPPALYPHREEPLTDLLADSFRDGSPALHRPGLGLAGRSIGGGGRWTVGLFANQSAPSAAGQADYLSRFVDPFVPTQRGIPGHS
jgi:hypothetical protein